MQGQLLELGALHRAFRVEAEDDKEAMEREMDQVPTYLTRERWLHRHLYLTAETEAARLMHCGSRRGSLTALKRLLANGSLWRLPGGSL